MGMPQRRIGLGGGWGFVYTKDDGGGEGIRDRIYARRADL